jgi:hypothetical protein
MKKTVVGLFAVVFLSLMVSGQSPQVVTVLKGFDPVELVDGREVKGLENLSVARGKYRYLFANEANKKYPLKN